jgi:hypothetical protein
MRERPDEHEHALLHLQTLPPNPISIHKYIGFSTHFVRICVPFLVRSAPVVLRPQLRSQVECYLPLQICAGRCRVPVLWALWMSLKNRKRARTVTNNIGRVLK